MKKRELRRPSLDQGAITKGAVAAALEGLPRSDAIELIAGITEGIKADLNEANEYICALAKERDDAIERLAKSEKMVEAMRSLAVNFGKDTQDTLVAIAASLESLAASMRGAKKLEVPSQEKVN